MGKMIKNGIPYGGSSSKAKSITYDNSDSKLRSTTVQGAIDDLTDNLGGFSFMSNPVVVYTVADSKPYVDENGNYVLADSTIGASLLTDTATYTSNTAEGNFYRIAGADSVIPFSGGGDASALYEALQYSGLVTEDMTFEEMCAVLAETYPELTYLFSNGAFGSLISTGMVLGYVSGHGSYSYAVTDGIITLKLDSGSIYSFQGWIVSQKPADVTNYKKVRFRVCASSGVTCAVYLCSNKISGAQATDRIANYAVVGNTIVSTAYVDLDIDVSNRTGSYYIAINMINTTNDVLKEGATGYIKCSEIALIA